MNRLRVAFRAIVFRTRTDRERNEELQYHLEREIDARMRSGLSRSDARAAALQTMGAIEKSKEESRDLWRWSGLSAIRQDLRFGLRLFRKHPGPVSIAVVGLAIAIAVVTSVFSIVNATMLRPYGMDDPASVVRVTTPGHAAWFGVWYDQFLRMKEGTTLARLEAGADERVRVSLARTDDGVANQPMSFVSGGYLEMLGGRPALGRSLQASDDAAAAPPVVVVSHQFWQYRLGSDPSAIGRTMWVNGVPALLVGVLDAEFTGPNEVRRSLWATLAAFDDLRMGPPVTESAPRVQVIARLASGTTSGPLRENLSAIVNRMAGSAPSAHGPGRSVDVHGAASPMSGPAEQDVIQGLALITTIVVLVLVLACANTSNLLRAAAVTRMREVGVRLAMGASRRRVVAQLIHESLLLGLIAGGLGFALSFWLVTFLGSVAALPPDPPLTPDGRVLLFTIVVALVCGFAAGLSPARYGARGNVLSALQSQSGSHGSPTMPSRFRTSFVGLQAAVSILLLVIAALLTRSAVRMTSLDIGFDAHRVIGVSFNAPRTGFDEPAYTRLATAIVRDLPPVQGVSVVQSHPFSYVRESARFSHSGRSYEFNVHRSDAGLFAAAGVRILRGRGFTPEEVASEAQVALISESAATMLFPGTDPLDRWLSERQRFGQDFRESPSRIVGIVGDAMMHRISSESSGAIYRPIARTRSNPPHLVIRASDPGAVARAVDDALRGIDARVQPSVVIVSERIEESLDLHRRLAWMIGPVAVLALLLSALGVYGVTTFVVSRRMEEMSVRMAVGASAVDVQRLLIWDSLKPVGLGLVVGLVLALAAAQYVASEIPGISPFDPLSIGGASSMLFAFALAAVVVPARRATRANPAELLKQT